METRTATETHEFYDEHETRNLADLLRELRDESVTLVRQEIALARTEMKEKVSRMGRNAAYLVIGGAVAYTGVIFLLLALSRLITVGLVNAGVSAGVAAWAGPGILGLVVAVIGLILIMKSWRTLSHESFVPEKTVQSLKEDTSWTRAKIREA